MDTQHSGVSRLRITTPVKIRSHFREDVAVGLQRSQKAIPAKYFYDRRGSLLFEQICQQPEYYLTRTEASILQAHVVDIWDEIGDCTIVELGSGSSVKTRLIFDEGQRRNLQLRYVPIDISASMLEATAKALVTEYPRIMVDALATDYLNGLTALPNGKPRLVIFLGSNLGNFTLEEQAQLFAQLTQTLQPGDFFLLGCDLQKPATILEPAYNDAAGVTSAFNLNLLRRMNRELAAQFDLSRFSHLAFYNQQLQQIEMHLQSEKEQEVKITDLNLCVSFRPEETIHTEISRKFSPTEVCAQLVSCGFRQCALWSDANEWFMVALFRFAGKPTGEN